MAFKSPPKQPRLCTNNDALAIGVLLPDPEGRNEIAIAGNVTGCIDIFRWNSSTWIKVYDFNRTYDRNNQFAVGNALAGNGQDEIIIARNGRDEIDDYRFEGSWSKYTTFEWLASTLVQLGGSNYTSQCNFAQASA